MAEDKLSSAQERLLELTLSCKRELEELLTMALFDCGAEGVEVQDNSIIMQHLAKGDWDASVFDGHELPTEQVLLRTLLPLDEAGRQVAAKISAAVSDYKDVVLSCREIVAEDWQQQWKKGFVARKVGRRFWLMPCWDKQPVPAGRLRLAINPGQVFGTGDHPTTEMVLQLLECNLLPESKVADLGCGSGILAIAALLLGAEQAVAVDIDENCRASVAEHMQLNQLPPHKLHYCTGNILADAKLQQQLREQPVQLITANITADILQLLAPLAAQFLLPGGCIICSGILVKWEQQVASALEEAGFCIEKRLHSGEWVAMAARLANSC